MIRLDLDEKTLHGVRIATSPLWEAVSSLVLLARHRGELPPPFASWGRTARRTLAPELKRELAIWVSSPHPLLLPSFLTPPPTSPRPTIHEELSAVSAITDDEIGRDLAAHPPMQVPGPLAKLDGRRKALSAFADLLLAYWELAMLPYWPLMRDALEEELLFRGRTLATDGPEAMLSELGGRLHWDRGQLVAPHQMDLNVRLEDAQLVLVPVLFARGMRIFSSGTDGSAISYQARGAGVVDSAGRAGRRAADVIDHHDRLAVLLGRGRASVMRVLVEPKTTTEIAQTLGLAQSTVSQHLGALYYAGVVRRERLGTRVLYELDHGGFALLRHIQRGRTG